MSLKAQLLERIHLDGPMSVADYMSECLLNPAYGYYTSRESIGANGDFITAPEISQIFGELIGLCLAQCWIAQGSPSPFALAELGPGRGTLMADILRATKGVSGFHDAARICLLEASPILRQKQAEALTTYTPTWIETLSEVPALPLFLVANEFFDALPIRQYQRDGGGWRERLIGAKDGDLGFGLGPQTAPSALNDRLQDTKDGDIVELCTHAEQIVSNLATHLAARGGGALIIDYGDWHSLGDTFQALRAHSPTDPLSAPGFADLTAHVDFEALANAAHLSGCKHTRLTPQGVFLERLGITARAQALAASQTGVAFDALVTAHRRLTHPEEMGNLFKVLGLYPAHASPLPGLEP